jgi:hypothetical protein
MTVFPYHSGSLHGAVARQILKRLCWPGNDVILTVVGVSPEICALQQRVCLVEVLTCLTKGRAWLHDMRL